MEELERIKEVYNKRIQRKTALLYSPWLPYIYMSRLEKEKKLFTLFKKENLHPLSNKKLLEIGCGKGSKILELIQMGFSPKNIIGNELMTDEAKIAQYQLPQSVSILLGDATKLSFPKNDFDIVYQSMVFSSILDDKFQKELANTIWQWLKPGGGILWYDFIYNNPNNKDVSSVPLSKIKKLFPDAMITSERVTLAPPINRRVTKIHPSLYSVFNFFPFLRTHVLCYIKKPLNNK